MGFEATAASVSWLRSHGLFPPKADGGDDDIGLTDDRGDILGFGMGDGDGAAFGQQQGGHGFADDVGPSDDHGVQPGQIP